MKIEIKSRFTGSMLFTHDVESNTMRLTVEAAVSARANLAGAYLAGANLAHANLAHAYLAGAYLAGANLAHANLAGAYLAGAYLAGAYLDDKSALRGLRPILQIGPLGSRCAYLVAYLTDKGIRIRAGCFFGGRAEFEKAVIETHGDGIYAKEYHAALAMIDAHAELWMPKEGGE